MLNINMKTKVYSDKHVIPYLRDIKNKKILIVCDSFMSHETRLKYLKDELSSHNKISIFNKAVPDPTLDVCILGIKEMLQVKPDIIIGYGGGSSIDTAKAILYFASMGNVYKKPIFIAVPTTSGTGSEVTSVSVIKDADTNRKHLLVSEDILPDVALLEPGLTLTIPKNITANTGLDVLTHSLEAYVSKNANAFSDALAEKSVELVFKSLINCYSHGGNYKARQSMQEASTLAGMAFNSAGLGLNHSIAHQIGGMFHIPHGLANAIILEKIIDFNSNDEATRSKYAKMAYKTQIVNVNASSKVALKMLKRLIGILIMSLEINMNLSEYDICKADYYSKISEMVKNTKEDFCFNTNPVTPTDADIEKIFKSIY
ncbi:MAG: 1-propanol dehydrogenase PduQ [Lachnospirales bacterium]